MGTAMHLSTGNDVDASKFLIMDRRLASPKLGVRHRTHGQLAHGDEAVEGLVPIGDAVSANHRGGIPGIPDHALLTARSNNAPVQFDRESLALPEVRYLTLALPRGFAVSPGEARERPPAGRPAVIRFRRRCFLSRSQELAGPAGTVQHATMSTIRILIVEDEPLIRLFVMDSLEEYGFQVLEADTAAEATKMLTAENGSVDAVIIDVGLPDRPGDVLAGELRTKWANLPIVIASGRDVNEFAKPFGQDARVAVLGKPYSTEMLLDALRKVGVTPNMPT